MTRRSKVLFSLTRKRIRPSYNKYNLFNAVTWRKNVRKGTLYQQIFSAKQETRSYHGEHLTETQFRNVFKSELNSVNPLQSTKAALAAADNSSQQQQEIPWALQTYVALERRLDTAIFRAMFAASIRQAAQYIVRGNVKVNGVKIKQPGYVLRPGDMFSVEPDRVLEALGRQKPSIKESVELVNNQIRKFNHYLKKCNAKPEVMWRLRQKNRKRNVAYYTKYMEKQITRNIAWNDQVRKDMNSQIDRITPVSVLESILRNEAYFNKYGTLPEDGGKEIFAKSLTIYGLVKGVDVSGVKSSKNNDSADSQSPADLKTSETSQQQSSTTAEKNKEASSSPSSTLVEKDSIVSSSSSPSTTNESVLSETIAKYYPSKTAVESSSTPANRSDVKKLVQDIVKARQEQIRKEGTSRLRDINNKNGSTERYDPKWVENLPDPLPLLRVNKAKEDFNSVLPIRLPFGHGKLYGLANPDKGYFTPWTPRQFLAPFSVLPHHIEVSFLSCHAVYLRDPVARPGHSELVSPFPLDMHERAHMYYFARRRKNI